MQYYINSTHCSLCFILSRLTLAFLSTWSGATTAANLRLTLMTSLISSLLSSKCTNIALTIYSMIDETEAVRGRYLHIKNRLIAVVIFLRMASWESSNLSNKITYRSLSCSPSIFSLYNYEHTCKHWATSLEISSNSTVVQGPNHH